MLRIPSTLVICLLAAAPALAQEQGEKPFEPFSGQPGKDVVWVPSPPETVVKMMEMGKITPQDFVIDLGSGDGRNVIAAAKRGANALGVEYNPDMVKLSRRLATEAGVADKAKFEEGDMYLADISKATVLALFLLPQNLEKLKDKFLALPPGTRMVMNSFSVPEWYPDETETVPNCEVWCNVMLYIVPAKVGGTWRSPQGTMTLTQKFQNVEGVFDANGVRTPVSGKLRGTQVMLKGADREATGTVTGDTMEIVQGGQTIRLTRAAATN